MDWCLEKKFIGNYLTKVQIFYRGGLPVGRTIQFPVQKLGKQGDGEALAKTPEHPKTGISRHPTCTRLVARSKLPTRHVVRQQEAQHLEEGSKTFLKGQLIVINSSQKGKNPEETRPDP